VIRVLIVAPSAIARAGLVAIVRGDPRLDVAGEATPGEAVAQVAALDPDVILEQRDQMTSGEPARAPSVVLFDEPRGSMVQAMLDDVARVETRAGLGILSRDATREEIVAALIAAAAGLSALQPRTLARASPRLSDGGPTDESPIESLTRRERDVLDQLARGATNRTIATRLSISEHTVKFHIGSILAKLGASSRTEAVTRGARLGLVML
jgi:DNA-binding NarL/FixJ family response regulator